MWGDEQKYQDIVNYLSSLNNIINKELEINTEEEEFAEDDDDNSRSDY